MRMTRSDLLVKILEDVGLKPSSARLQILDICMTSSQPLDVDTVISKLGDTIHLATVYRTLEKFVHLDLLEKIDFQEGKFRYEYMQDHHHHAICNSCGRVQDIMDTDTGIVDMKNDVSSKLGFKVTKHVIELFGICTKCQKKGIYGK